MLIFTHPSTNFARFKETGVFFQIVGMDPCLILLSAPLKWIARVKQSFAKCMEQNGKCSFGIEVFTMHAHKSFPLCANAAACRRSMHRNSQFLVGLSITVLNYTASWGHFVPGNSKRSTSNISHLSHFSYIAYENSHDVLTGCEYHVTSHPRQLDPTPFICARPIFKLSNGGNPNPKNTVKIIRLPVRILS